MGLRAWLKGFNFTRIVSGGSSSLVIPLSTVNYASMADTSTNSAVMAVVNWYARTTTEAPLVVQSQDENGVMELDHGHELSRLLRRPNPFYSGALLQMAIMADYVLTGNAYILKVRAASRRVVELWWAPSWMVTPVHERDSENFVDFYKVGSGGGVEERWAIEDVVHHRWGLDPSNPIRGMSPLTSLFREIYTDDEAARFTATILKNLAIPGVILSPEGDAAADESAVEEIKERYQDAVGGDNRGGVIVMRSATKVQTLSWSPRELQLREVRKIPEERITAVLGIAAVVAGLGAGLDRSTFANFAEAREAAYESGLIPIQRLHAEDLSTQLLPDFDDRPDATVARDYREVRVLQEDETEKAKRHAGLVMGSIETRGEARAALGLAVKPADDVYLIPISTMEIGPGADPLTLIGGRTLVPADDEGNPLEEPKALLLEEPAANGAE